MQTEVKIGQSKIQRLNKNINRQSSSHSSDVSRSVTPLSRPYTPAGESRSTTPQLSKQNSVNSLGMFTPVSCRSRNINYEENFLSLHQLHSSDLYDSDYGAYQVGRSAVEERLLSRMGSTSYISENDYSAFTPVIDRKMSLSSVCSTPLQTPKLNRDFGFVSSKKEMVPKPPRRRSKDPNGWSRPGSRQHHSSSRESTPVNTPAAKSPVRPTRLRSKNYSEMQTRHGQKYNNEKPVRPRSLQENCQDPGYEILTPVCQSQTFNSSRRQQKCYISSSDSDDDFKTPQASPRFMRPSTKNKNRRKDARHSSVYEEFEVGSQSYQNFKDNPLLNEKKRNSRILPTEDTADNKISKPKLIPPRTSQEPIPTPRRQSGLARSRDQSTESLNSLNSLPRKLYPKREPHYKVPPPNPRPVTPTESHFYSELIYDKENKEINNKDSPLSIYRKEKQTNESSRSARKQPPGVKSKKTKPSEKDKESERVNRKFFQDNYPSCEDKQKPREEKKRNVDQDNLSDKSADSRVSVELTGEEDKFYDAKEEILKKTKAIATLPNGSKYPCVIVQKKSKKELKSSNSFDSKKDRIKDEPPTKAKRTFKNYTPVEMKMKPDWFEELKIKENKNQPRPTSIVDGVLYTSKALMDEDNKKMENKKINSFNLIEPEVFQTYDVCRNSTKDIEKRSKV